MTSSLAKAVAGRHTLIPRLIGVAGIVVAMAGCGNSGTATVAPDPPSFDDPHLQAGRSTWMMTCRACHLTGVAGAPAVADFDAWAPRLAKGRSALYARAIDGIRADGGWTMPPQGWQREVVGQTGECRSGLHARRSRRRQSQRPDTGLNEQRHLGISA